MGSVSDDTHFFILHPFVYPNLPASSVEWEPHGELLAKESLEFGMRCKIGYRYRILLSPE